MKKIYEDINRILSEKKSTSSSESQLVSERQSAYKPEYSDPNWKDARKSVSDVKYKTRVTDFVPDLKTPMNRRGGLPDGLPKRLAGSLGRGANILALADVLTTHGELNTGEDDELKKKRASDPKYQEAERQLNKPRPVNFRDDKGIQYDTKGNPFRDPNKEAMATHSAITKKDIVPQASSISTTRRATTKRVASDNTASSNQTTATTYWTNPNQPAKPEPAKPEPAKPEPAKPEPAKPAWTEPAYPEPKANSTKPEPPKAEPKADVSSVAKEYIKANVSNKPDLTSTEEKPEEKSKRVKIIKPTTSESSVLGRIRNALSEKHQVDEVIGVGTKAVKYGPSAIRFGYKFFRDVFKDNKSEVTVTKPPPAPKPESKPQPQLPPPASAAKVERQVSTSKDVVKTEPKQSSVNVSKDAKTERQVNVSKEVRSDKSEKGRRIGQKNATQDVVVRQAEPVKTDNVPAVKKDNKPVVKTDNVPAVRTDNVPAVRTQTGTAVVTTTTNKDQTATKPETRSKLQRIGPPPPPPPVDQQTAEPEPPKKNTFKHGPEPQIIKKFPPPETNPEPQPNNVVPPAPPAPPPPPPPPPPPKKGPSLVDPVPQPSIVEPPKPAPKQTTPDCPTGECDPNLNVKAMYNRLASATSKGYKESKPKFSMEDTQMNINKKFNVSDNLYQSVMEVMTKAKKPGSVPGNQAERDLAAKHGDPDRITHGDILVARGVVKSNKPPVKSVKEGVFRNGKYVDVAPGKNELAVPGDGSPESMTPPKSEKKPAKKSQPGSTTKAMDDMEEEISISKTVGKVVGSVEKGVSNMAKDFEAGRQEAKKDKPLPAAMVSSPVAKAAAMSSAKDATGDTGSTSSRPYLRTTPTSSSESDIPTDFSYSKLLNKGEDEELAKRRAADPKYQSLARSTQKESRDTPGNSYEHQCAIHVKSESFGEGRTITTQHADPDAYGNIAWYDVMFEHGIEKYVPTNELEILVSESHMHAKRKKKGM